MMIKAFIILVICLAANARIHYNGYKVFRAIPQSEDDVQFLKELENLGLSFWQGPNPVGRPSDIMFPPHMQGDELESLQASGMEVSEFIDDIESLIQQEVVQDSRDATLNFDFAQYHTVPDIYAFLEQSAANHSSASVSSIGSSYEGRELKLLTISTGGGGTKPAIWFDANIHAREWITGAVACYVINELLTSTDPVVRRWTQDYDWFILPVHNPDGLEYTRTSRLWRKTRSVHPTNTCRGADPNRNFGFRWYTGGSSNNPCSDTFAGTRAFSEPETLAASNFQNSIANRLKFVLSLHSYSQLILIPYGVDLPFPPHQEYMRIGQRTANAIRQRYGTVFRTGNIVDLLYVASGGSTDWAHGVHNVALTYTFELRDTGSYGFLLPANQIIPSSLEFLDGLAVMVEELGFLLAKEAAAKA